MLMDKLLYISLLHICLHHFDIKEYAGIQGCTTLHQTFVSGSFQYSHSEIRKLKHGEYKRVETQHPGYAKTESAGK